MSRRYIHSYLTPVLRSVGIESSTQITLLTSGLGKYHSSFRIAADTDVMVIAIWNLVLAFSAALNVERFGRRTLFFVSTTGMLISYVLVMGLSAGFATTKDRAVGFAVVPFLFL